MGHRVSSQQRVFRGFVFGFRENGCRSKGAAIEGGYDHEREVDRRDNIRNERFKRREELQLA